MRIRLPFAALVLVVGCSSSQRVEGADEAELTRNAGAAPEAGPEQSGREAPDGGLVRFAHEPRIPPVGPLVDTACKATTEDTCAAGCTARTGGMLDREHHCVITVVFACIPTVANEASIASCFKRVADGRVVLTGAVPHDLVGPEWTGCTEEDWANWPDSECRN